MANEQQAELINAMRLAAASSLAGGIIAASQRAHSVEEAIELAHSCFFRLFPMPGHGRYETWKNQAKTSEPHR